MQKIMFNEKYGLQRAAIAGTKPMTRRSVPDKWKIDKVSGRGTWNRNPWVFAYSYELVK